MPALKRYTLAEIDRDLNDHRFPFSGMTELGSARFEFSEPAFYAGTAIHVGHRIREQLRGALAVSPADRLREEDPGTDRFIKGFPMQVVALDSRFEYDVNRSIERAIPLTPDMAWGLTVWKRPLSKVEINTSLAKYREFHQLMDIVVDFIIQQHERAFIFDLHSYCYQREARLPRDADQKPEINIGTEAINQALFRKDIGGFIRALKQITLEGKALSVAENEVFKGGYLARRLCARNYDQLAVFAIEFKKIFMDEWSGRFYPVIFGELVDKFTKAVSSFIIDIKAA